MELTGKVCEFYFGDKTPRRRFMVVTMTYAQIRKFLKHEPYSSLTNTGEQRHRNENHVKRLEKAMRSGTFTPAPWTAGLREWHLENLKINHDTRHAVLKIEPDNPLPCLDGGHRWGALDKIYATADVMMKRFLDTCSFAVQILLDPAYVRADFQRLQEGLKMDKSHLLSLRLADDTADPKRSPVLKIGREVTLTLNNREQSHLHNQIKFDTSDKSAPIGFEKLLTFAGADLSTSMVTACRLAILYKEQANKDLLVNAYVAAYQSIRKYGQTETTTVGTEEITEPVLLQKDKVLRPLKEAGTKGGTRLLVGMGNCLIFRKLFMGEHQITPEDMQHLANAAENSMNEYTEKNLSNARIRELMGEFAREYFKDLVGTDMVFRDGVPDILVTETGESTWAIRKEQETEFESPAEMEDEPIESVETFENGQSDTDPEWHSEPEAVETTEEIVEEEPEQPKPTKKSKRGKSRRSVMG